ncbi:glycosyltransferase [Pelagicoccus sp. SDUM812003]|uniref:glycosyltransferase n=1 Tax=Pelagicoccus sp. SDUM812003 TaxID=3041267 RepID=UPI00280D4A19|nr:glycosyltransferase [Pelagicoccus sp. SDUM812003]MDQ8205587.1 glycosyltransferase [Pelagicoccus sp. SDUM812003]
MARRDRRFGWRFYACCLLVVGLATGKFWLGLNGNAPEAAHAETIDAIQAQLSGKTKYRFAVVGNINNSIGIFEHKIIPKLNEADIDFVVSAGNAVTSGGEDKYRALRSMFAKLKAPYVLAFGENERKALGSYRFYDHYGPYVHAFVAGNARFLFLDSTGKTSWNWQFSWLAEELSKSKSQHTFAFCPTTPVPVGVSEDFNDDPEDYILEESVREKLVAQLAGNDVDAVFSTGLPVYSSSQMLDVRFVMTGGAGGLLDSDDNGHYHYVLVTVDGERAAIEPVLLDIGQSPIQRAYEGLWLAFLSLLYVGYLDILLTLAAAVLVAVWIYRAFLEDRDFYPSYDAPPIVNPTRPLRVAMFTNSYLPFVGGVPVAIDRLRQSLEPLGHKVMVVTPDVADAPEDDCCHRLPLLLRAKPGSAVAIANIFSRKAFKEVKSFKPDVVHLHHPFWVGSLGLFVARRLGVPAIYTYHTRLESFAHAVPLPSAFFRNFLAHFIVRRFANRCDSVIVPTDSAEHYLRAIGVRSPIQIQPTGIECQRFQNRDTRLSESLKSQLGLDRYGCRTLVCVSRLSPEKNVSFIVDGIAELAADCPVDFTLLILGDGPQRQFLEAKIERLGLQKHIRLLGSVPPKEVANYYHLGDLFVFASQAETQGMVILEAMAAGLPVVAVRASGIDDFIVDGHNGYKTLLQPQEWAEKVRRLLINNRELDQMGRNAMRLAMNFDTSRFGVAISRVYRQYVREGTTSTPYAEHT